MRELHQLHFTPSVQGSTECKAYSLLFPVSRVNAKSNGERKSDFICGMFHSEIALNIAIQIIIEVHTRTANIMRSTETTTVPREGTIECVGSLKNECVVAIEWITLYICKSKNEVVVYNSKGWL